MNRLGKLLGFLRPTKSAKKKRRPRRPTAGRARVSDGPQRGLEYVPGGGFAGPEGMRRGKAAALEYSTEEAKKREHWQKKINKYLKRRKAERLRLKNRKVPYDAGNLHPYPSPSYEA